MFSNSWGSRLKLVMLMLAATLAAYALAQFQASAISWVLTRAAEQSCTKVIAKVTFK
jgi:hypothetical protein